MPTVIKLSGSLAQRFGREHVRYLETGTTAEAMAALRHTLDGFEQAIVQLASKGIEFVVFKNRRNITADDLSEGGAKEIRVIPRIDGSKGGGFFGAILGGALIGLSFLATGGLATGLLIAGGVIGGGGLMQLLSPQPKTPKNIEREGNDPSYGFGGPVSTTASGHPVPLLYGEYPCGGAYISASTVTEDVPVK